MAAAFEDREGQDYSAFLIAPLPPPASPARQLLAECAGRPARGVPSPRRGLRAAPGCAYTE